jgi:hypothetical protein
MIACLGLGRPWNETNLKAAEARRLMRGVTGLPGIGLPEAPSSGQHHQTPLFIFQK